LQLVQMVLQFFDARLHSGYQGEVQRA
jgi:hypothetical protein